MSILSGNLIYAVYWLVTFVDYILTFYLYVIIAASIISWVSPDPYNPIVNMLYRLTEPLLGRIRKHMPGGWAIDLSPMVAFIGIMMVKMIVLDTIEKNLLRLYSAVTLPTPFR